MRININLTDIPSGFDTYPKGRYIVEIQESTKVKADEISPDRPYIHWIAKISEGEFEGKLISWRTYFDEECKWVLKNVVEAAGVTYDEKGFEMDEVFNRTIGITNDPQMFRRNPNDPGELRNNVKGDGFFRIGQATAPEQSGSAKKGKAKKAEEENLPF